MPPAWMFTALNQAGQGNEPRGSLQALRAPVSRRHVHRSAGGAPGDDRKVHEVSHSPQPLAGAQGHLPLVSERPGKPVPGGLSPTRAAALVVVILGVVAGAYAVGRAGESEAPPTGQPAVPLSNDLKPAAAMGPLGDASPLPRHARVRRPPRPPRRVARRAVRRRRAASRHASAPAPVVPQRT